MGPGKYDYNDTRGKQVSVSSPFRSGTQKGLRFDSSATPGPGSYKTTEDLVSNTNEKSPKVIKYSFIVIIMWLIFFCR